MIEFILVLFAAALMMGCMALLGYLAAHGIKEKNT